MCLRVGGDPRGMARVGALWRTGRSSGWCGGAARGPTAQGPPRPPHLEQEPVRVGKEGGVREPRGPAVCPLRHASRRQGRGR